MGHPRLSGDEIVPHGQELYEREIRNKVEMEENIGKIISINIETGDYAFDKDPMVAADRVFAWHPGAALFGARIGYDAAFAIGGGSLTLAP